MYSRILVPVDGSEFSEKAVKEAANLGHALGSKLLLFHAAAEHVPPLVEGMSAATRPRERAQAKKEIEDWAQAVLSAAAKKAKLSNGNVEQHFEISNSPYEAIIDAARDTGCDLIVMASHGRRGLAGLLLGSETQKVLAHSRLPVLVVR